MLRRRNHFLAKAAPIEEGTGVVLYVPTPERGNELFYLAVDQILLKEGSAQIFINIYR